jgi:glutamate/tyrosine decarboxylase-like PLP-dependent enzyme
MFCEPKKKMEDEVLNKLAIQVGWHSYDGILSPGGSINNLYACMIARHRAMPCMSKDTFHENVFLNRFNYRFVLSALIKLNDPFTFPVRR